MKAELIIPTRDNDGSDNAAVIEASIRTMCTMFGGVTVFDARGYWVNDNGHLYEDAVVVMVSAATESTKMEELRMLARSVLEITDQEAVFVSLNGKAEIIE